MKTVLHYLEESAARFPDKIAVIDETGSCTYRSLLRNSRQMASALSHTLSPGQGVILLMDKSIATLTAMMAVVSAGGFYSVFSPHLPQHRLRQMQATLAASLVLAPAALFNDDRQIFSDTPVLCLEELGQGAIDDRRLARIRAQMLDVDPLYVNFTSGSTGQPKGVVVSHRSVVDFIDVFTRLFSIQSEDIIGNQAPFDFDVSVKDIYSAMKTGAQLVILPRALFSQPAQLLDRLVSHQVTTLIWAVSALSLVCTFHALQYRVPHSVSKVLFSGEVMPPSHLRQWMEALPEALFVNLYGPTEITCNCTYHIVDRSRTYPHGLPIGKAFPNEEVFLLDSYQKRIDKPHVRGEICVRGSALALGYINNEEQTAARFVHNPLQSRFPQTLYRTGDLGYLNSQGELMFCGRQDFQIKLQGHRIELEDIEHAMQTLPQVEQCRCVYDGCRIHAFYCGQAQPETLRKELAMQLPGYMIPARLNQLDRMPLNANGKIDRSALLALTGGKNNEH